MSPVSENSLRLAMMDPSRLLDGFRYGAEAQVMPDPVTMDSIHQAYRDYQRANADRPTVVVPPGVTNLDTIFGCPVVVSRHVPAGTAYVVRTDAFLPPSPYEWSAPEITEQPQSPAWASPDEHAVRFSQMGAAAEAEMAEWDAILHPR